MRGFTSLFCAMSLNNRRYYLAEVCWNTKRFYGREVTMLCDSVILPCGDPAIARRDFRISIEVWSNIRFIKGSKSPT